MELNLNTGCPSREASNAEKGEINYIKMVGDDGKELFNGGKGFPQPKSYKDWTFTALFLFHLGLIIYPLVMAFTSQDIELSGYETLAYFTIYCSAFATIVSIIVFKLMVKYPFRWIQSSMTVCLNLFLGTAIVAYILKQPAAWITSAVLFVTCLVYVAFSWRRIPSARAKFSTAVMVIDSNNGLFIVALILQIVAIVWSIVWLIACTWAKDSIHFSMIFVFLISYFWVEQVLKNIIHVIVAGFIGAWWQTPGDRAHSKALGRSLNQAFSTSFGSICFGSLFVNYFHGLRHLVTFVYEERWKCLYVVVSSLFGCARDVFVYMNKWAFVYVGLYGYSFFQSGKNVTILFHGKGWKQLVTDDLTDNIILILNLAVATATGVAGIGFASNYDHYQMLITMYTHPYAAGFAIGFLVGYLISAVLLGVIGGAVNAIIVCFAESPVAFMNNHHRHSQMLRDGWVLDLPKPPSNRSIQGW
mmetsp:Transcript_6907/g.15765  ORF Transcript_6907/g.15765 Transcript_6907/m.15765 type:complete len:472 (+) Transcript_6907:195-1610(+)